VRLGLDMVIVILNNNNYGMIKWKQKNEDFKDYGLDFSNPNFEMLATSFGAIGYTVHNKEDFKPTLETALAGK
jgi:acetolactate synthase-1/2/3 large subunit